jgi:hypothetical protein
LGLETFYRIGRIGFAGMIEEDELVSLDKLNILR